MERMEIFVSPQGSVTIFLEKCLIKHNPKAKAVRSFLIFVRLEENIRVFLLAREDQKYTRRLIAED